MIIEKNLKKSIFCKILLKKGKGFQTKISIFISGGFEDRCLESQHQLYVYVTKRSQANKGTKNEVEQLNQTYCLKFRLRLAIPTLKR